MIILLRDYWILRYFDINFIIIIIVVSASGVMALHLRYIIIATLKTRTLVFREIIFSTTKISLAIALILLGMGAEGLTISFAIAQILVAILLGTTILSLLKSTKKEKSEISFYQASKNILAAGIPSWISALIATLGSQLGTIVVFQSAGASPAGAYFLSFSIVSGITTIMYSLLTATFPALSAMTDGRKRFAWHLTKLSLLFSLPFSSSIIFYSKQIMELFGKDYVQGTSSLEILLLSVMPSAVTTGLNILVYSYGNYRQVLMIGLGSSIPRAVLYFVLVPIYGSDGSAISYTIGSILGFIVSIMIAEKIGLRILWKDLGYMLLIPIIIGFVVSHTGVYYITGIFITLVTSYVLLIKLQVITRLDVADTFGILPNTISVPVVRFLNKLGKKLNSSY
jgi:O-antigen/teichoic acid export membrane protein